MPACQMPREWRHEGAPPVSVCPWCVLVPVLRRSPAHQDLTHSTRSAALLRPLLLLPFGRPVLLLCSGGHCCTIVAARAVAARAAAAAARAATVRAAAAAARATADDATVSLSLSFAFPCLSRAQPLGSALHRASRPQRRRMRLCARAIADSRVQCAAAMSVTSDVLAASYFRLPTSHIPASVSVSQRTKRCSRVISQQYSNGFGARLID